MKRAGCLTEGGRARTDPSAPRAIREAVRLRPAPARRPFFRPTPPRLAVLPARTTTPGHDGYGAVRPHPHALPHPQSPEAETENRQP